MTTTLSSIFVFPIKSCGGISLTEAHLDKRGIQYDRLWMVVDGWTNKFLSQRTHPELALVKTAFVDNMLHITADGVRSGIAVPLSKETPYDRKRKVTVH